MPGKALSELRARKELLIARSDLHRELLALECSRVSGPRTLAGFAFSSRGGWVLLGGAALGGFLLIRHWRRLTLLLPSLVAVLRLLPR